MVGKLRLFTRWHTFGKGLELWHLVQSHRADELNISQLCFVFLPLGAGQPPALGFTASASQFVTVAPGEDCPCWHELLRNWIFIPREIDWLPLQTCREDKYWNTKETSGKFWVGTFSSEYGCGVHVFVGTVGCGIWENHHATVSFHAFLCSVAGHQQIPQTW